MAIAFVQAKSAGAAGPSTSLNCAFTSAQVAGNFNVVVVNHFDATTATVISVTDSKGNSYKLAVGPTTVGGSTPCQQSTYYAQNILAGTNTVTCTWSAGVTFPGVIAFEYSGLPVSGGSILDGTAAASGTATAAGTVVSSGSLTTTNTHDLVFASIMSDGGATAYGSGWTGRLVDSLGGRSEDQIVSATGTFAGTATVSTGGWVAQAVAFSDTASNAIALTSSAKATIHCDGTLTVPSLAKALTGSAKATFTGGGKLGRALTGSAKVTASASGTLSLKKPLVGSAAVTFSGGGTLTVPGVSKALTGSAKVTASASGTLSLKKPLVGSAAITFSGGGTLTVPTLAKALTGAAHITVSASGTLSLKKPFVGSTAITFSGGGTLSGGAPPIAFVQAKSNGFGGTASSLPCAFTSAQVAGNFNVVAVNHFDATTATVTSVTDSNGKTYTLAAGPTTVGGTTPCQQSIYYLQNITGGTTTITCTWSAAVSFPGIIALEYSGLPITGGILDGIAAASGTAPGVGTAISSGNLTTTNPKDLIYASIMSDGGATAYGSGWTGRLVDGAGGRTEDQIVSSTGTFAGTATVNTGGWVAQTVAFRDTASNVAALTGGSKATFTGGGTLTVVGNAIALTGSAKATFSDGGILTVPTLAKALTGTAKITASASGTLSLSGGAPPIAFVQIKGNGASSATSLACTPTSAQIAGNFNVVVVNHFDATTATVTSVTDSNGKTYALGAGPTTVGGTTPCQQSIYYLQNITGGSTTVTCTWSAAVTFPGVIVAEYSGIPITGSILDGIAAGSGTASASGTAVSSGNLTSTNSHDLIFASIMADGGATAYGSGWTGRLVDSLGGRTEDQIVSSTGTFAGTATVSTGGWVAQAVAFRNVANNALALIGGSKITFTAGGPLTVPNSTIQVTGAAKITGSASGTLSLNKSLIGSAAAKFSASGSLGVKKSLTGAANIVFSNHLTLNRQLGYWNDKAATWNSSTVTWNSQGVWPLVATANFKVTSAGHLTTGPPLSGKASFKATAAGLLSLAVPLRAASTIHASASGNLLVSIPISGTAAFKLTAAPHLTVSVPLKGASKVTVSSSSALSVNLLLNATGHFLISSAGHLLVNLPLKGAVATTYAAGGTIQVKQALNATGSSKFSASGALTVAIPLSAASHATFKAAGSLASTSALKGASKISVSGGTTVHINYGLKGSGAFSIHAGGSLVSVGAGSVDLIASSNPTVKAIGRLSLATTLPHAQVNVILTSSGRLTVIAPLKAASNFVLGASGHLTVKIPFKGASQFSVLSSGQLTNNGSLVGQASVSIKSSGKLSLSVPVSGSTTFKTNAIGRLSLAIPITGATNIRFSIGGALHFSGGSANLVSNSSIHVTATGTLTVFTILIGKASIRAQSSGTITINKSLSGAVVIGVTARGVPSLDLGFRALSGSSSLRLRSAGSLSLHYPLFGKSFVSFRSGGGLVHGNFFSLIGGSAIYFTNYGTLLSRTRSIRGLVPDSGSNFYPSGTVWSEGISIGANLVLNPAINVPNPTGVYRLIDTGSSNINGGQFLGTLTLNGSQAYAIDRALSLIGGPDSELSAYRAFITDRLTNPQNYTASGRLLSFYSIGEQLSLIKVYWEQAKAMPPMDDPNLQSFNWRGGQNVGAGAKLLLRPGGGVPDENGRYYLVDLSVPSGTGTQVLGMVRLNSFQAKALTDALNDVIHPDAVTMDYDNFITQRLLNPTQYVANSGHLSDYTVAEQIAILNQIWQTKHTRIINRLA